MAKSVYEMVTERIIKQLENNVIPWKKPCLIFIEPIT